MWMCVHRRGRQEAQTVPPSPEPEGHFFFKKKSMENKGKYRKLSLKESNVKPDSLIRTHYTTCNSAERKILKVCKEMLSERDQKAGSISRLCVDSKMAGEF